MKPRWLGMALLTLAARAANVARANDLASMRVKIVTQTNTYR
jgi:hypothetical protein